MREPVERRATAETTASELGPLLTVVVPVFNQEAVIAANVETIRGALEAGLGDDFELIVVSDGSIDRTAERVLDEHGGEIRVIHYDRNLGKGYAVKIGALEARGRYVGYIDADLDLDPAWLPRFVAVAEERAARLRDRLQAPSRLGRLLPALAPRRQLALPAARPGALPAQRPRHAGRAEGLPAGGRRAGAAAAPREAVRLRPRAARGVARARLLPHRGAADPARLPLHRLRRALARGAARARRHRGDLLPAADPALLPAAASCSAGRSAGRDHAATDRSYPS